MKNEELFEVDSKTIRFIADFGFGLSVCKMGRDITDIFSDLASGKLPVEDICNIMICSMHDIDGAEIKETDKKAIAEDIINKYGLQQCHQLAWVLLSHIMIGEKKSSEIDIAQRREAMTEKMNPGHSQSSKKVGLLWVAMWTSSTLLACMISSFYALHIA